MRVDTFPSDGEFAGSDPELAFKQLIIGGRVGIAILEPAAYSARIPEANSAMCSALNRWQDNHWLDSHNNWHERCAARSVPISRSRKPLLENREVAGHEYMAQVLIKAEPRPPWGNPKYDPIWAAATKHDIPVSCHLSRGHFDELPFPRSDCRATTTTSWSRTRCWPPTSNEPDLRRHLRRFPTLRIVFVEHAFTWILPLMWRMDAIYSQRKQWMDIKRKPSEYVKEHIKFTTQPLDYPRTRRS